MSEDSDLLLEKAINEKIEIGAYDPAWDQQFSLERDRLHRLFPNRLREIEHVGSTSVPGLSAKPIIDIIATVVSMEEADELLPQLCLAGYTTSAEFNATLGDRRWLMKHANGRRTHHLYLLLKSGEDWSDKIRFRNLLRRDAMLRDAYAELKHTLAGALGSDREAYTQAKTQFIRAALTRE